MTRPAIASVEHGVIAWPAADVSASRPDRSAAERRSVGVVCSRCWLSLVSVRPTLARLVTRMGGA